jgi:REP element-mobilizing transposase RayT
LKNPEIAEMVITELHRFDGELYDLVAYTIMSNHVHILIDTNLQVPATIKLISAFEEINFDPLQVIMKRIKGPTAIYANRLLKREGQFWQRESYDRFIRDGEEFYNTIWYILNNPVKAGLVKEWELYDYTFLRSRE